MEILWGSFIIQIVAFIILFLLLKRYAFGPLVNIMETRQENIKEQISSAENNKLEAEKILKEQKENFQEARIEAQEMIERARVSSSKQAEEIIATAKAEAVRIKDQAVQEIQQEKNKAVDELRKQVGVLSVLIASKLIEKEIDLQGQSKFIDEMIKEVGEVQ
ncbi:MAG: F0F1 ATP synthase subunit B [Vulcanibacillus sp.]